MWLIPGQTFGGDGIEHTSVFSPKASSAFESAIPALIKVSWRERETPAYSLAGLTKQISR